jgi:alcohol dehydrogenase (cytochrome c)
LFYLQYSEGGQRYVSVPEKFEAGKMYIGRAPASGRDVNLRPGEPAPSAGVKAIDPDSGKTVWDFKISRRSLAAGVLATAGNVVFSAVRDGSLIALDAKTGTYLWHFQTETTMAASPMSYAIDGRQYVAISAGNTVYSFTLPE